MRCDAQESYMFKQWPQEHNCSKLKRKTNQFNPHNWTNLGVLLSCFSSSFTAFSALVSKISTFFSCLFWGISSDPCCCLFVHLFVRLLVCLFVVCLFVCLFVRSFVCLFIRSFVRSSVRPSVRPSVVCLFVCLLVCLLFVACCLSFVVSCCFCYLVCKGPSGFSTFSMHRVPIADFESPIGSSG